MEVARPNPASPEPASRERGSITIHDVLGTGGLLAQLTKDAFEHREGQLRMAEAIQGRIAAGGCLVVEAPTGIGKTLGYLVPALLSGRQVVVSTNTKNLQDQIIEKDLPLLSSALAGAGVSVERSDAEHPPSLASTLRYALMKGRANYLCLERLERRTAQLALPLGGADVLTEIGAWSRTTKRGDRAELIGLEERSELWSDLDARADRCLGQRCARYDDCFVVRMRREAELSDLIVVNHHLLFAEIALAARARILGLPRFAQIIPKADVLIVDEAHAIEEIASEYFGGSVSSGKVDRLARDASGIDAVRRSSVVERLLAAMSKVFAALPLGEGRVRIQRGTQHVGLAPALEAFGELCERLTASQDPHVESIADRAKETADALRFVLTAEDRDYVYYSERRGRTALLGASLVEISGLLEEHLFSAFDTVVLTSATLSVGKDLGFYRRTVGVPRGSKELVLESPFDFTTQAALYLPKDAPDPSEPAAPERLASIGKDLIDLVGGGALFLFTSHRMMRLVHSLLADRLEYPVLVQGDAPRHRLLEAFIAQAPSVLFATASFWEGVDVPGDPLRLVLIDRLPFDPPNDPLICAKTERLGDEAFASFQLPRAILRLCQGFGRLVRTRSDRGVVAVLDRRVRTRAYGRHFLEALPDAHCVEDFEPLSRWWRRELPLGGSGSHR